jgi:hypothetical protein
MACRLPVAGGDNPLGTSFVLRHCGPVSTANPPPPPDIGDLRGLAHDLRQLFEIAASTLGDDTQPSELARRVTSHLGCELTAIVPVTERFPKWEHVNVQRGVDAYLTARQNELAQDESAWFGAPGAVVPPHENLLSLLSMPAQAGASASPVPAASGSWARAPPGPAPPATPRPRSGRRGTPRS